MPLMLLTAPRSRHIPLALFPAGLLIWIALASMVHAGQQPNAAAPEKAEPKLDTSKLVVAPNLAAQVAKFQSVRMPFDSAMLSPRERQLVGKLVEACQFLEDIYWRQSDPEGLALYRALEGSTAPRDVLVRRFLIINGSRFDLIGNDAPFVGTAPRPPGRGFFPADLTREELDRYVATHPAQKAALY